jgi:hypothetical protein
MGVPTVTPLVENRREGGFVVYDPSDGMFTRKAALLLSGAGVCIAGLVLAATLTGGAATSAALGTNTGTGAMGAITVTGAARVGDYRLIVVEPAANAGAFIVEDPDGVIIGHGNVASVFTAGGLSFTLADATDYIAGDVIVISVTGTVKYAPYDPTATNGLQYAAAIQWSGVRDATSADRRTVINFKGPMKVQTAELLWGANVTTDAHKITALAQLEKLGILNV